MTDERTDEEVVRWAIERRIAAFLRRELPLHALASDLDVIIGNSTAAAMLAADLSERGRRLWDVVEEANALVLAGTDSIDEAREWLEPRLREFIDYLRQE